MPAGVVSQKEAYLAAQMGDLNAVAVVVDLMRTDIVPDTDSIDRALELFVENQLLELPVVHGPDQRVVGLVRRADISSAYLRNVKQATSDAASRPRALGPSSHRGICYNCLILGVYGVATRAHRLKLSIRSL